MSIRIKLLDYFGHTLNSREAATLVFEKHSTIDDMYIDFDKVEFISRSFADQFVKEQRKARESGIMVNVENAVEDIIKLLEIVRRTQQPRQKERFSLPVVTYSDKYKLFQYLETL